MSIDKILFYRVRLATCATVTVWLYYNTCVPVRIYEADARKNISIYVCSVFVDDVSNSQSNYFKLVINGVFSLSYAPSISVIWFDLSYFFGHTITPEKTGYNEINHMFSKRMYMVSKNLLQKRHEIITRIIISLDDHTRVPYYYNIIIIIIIIINAPIIIRK